MSGAAEDAPELDPRAVQTRQILDAIALLAAQNTRTQELLERIAVGLGVDPYAPTPRR